MNIQFTGGIYFTPEFEKTRDGFEAIYEAMRVIRSSGTDVEKLNNLLATGQDAVELRNAQDEFGIRMEQKSEELQPSSLERNEKFAQLLDWVKEEKIVETKVAEIKEKAKKGDFGVSDDVLRQFPESVRQQLDLDA